MAPLRSKSALDEIRSLDPVRDHQRIVFLTTRVDFPFDTVRSLELGLFRTFCVPSISGLLDRTGEFEHRAQKRYDDTDLIVSEMMDHGYESERGRRALERMNELHGRFKIRNEDFLYVLSTFVFEPIRWIGRYGWRPLAEAEKLAMFHFWREVGRRMGIRDIPEEYGDLERLNVAYERDHYRPAETNHRVGTATVEMFMRWFPRVLRPLARRAMYGLMDERLIECFGFPRPSRATRWLVDRALRLRASALRVLPRRRKPVIRTARRQRSYPEGYVIEELGPPAPPFSRSKME